jgi:hypothetical protein
MKHGQKTMSSQPGSDERTTPRARAKALFVILLPLAVAAAVVGDDFDLRRSTIDGGGVMLSAGGDFELSGTIGQPDAGAASGGAFVLTGGFWFQQVPADCNFDGGVDLYDYATFEACMSGPDGGMLEPPCICFDLDGDGDVDLGDVGAFQRSFSG